MTPEKVLRETIYPHPPERVWDAITDSATLAQWLWPTTFEPRLGCQFIFTASPQAGWDGVVECEVVECEPPRRLAYTWHGDPAAPATLVTFTLARLTRGTHLRLEHIRCAGESGGDASLHDVDAWAAGLSHLLHLQVDHGPLTDALFATLTRPGAWGDDPSLVRALDAVAPDMIPVLESMALDGVDERPHVAHYIHALARGRIGPAAVSPSIWAPPVAPPRPDEIAHRSPLVQLHIDAAPLADILYACVRDPRDHEARHALSDWHDLAPDLLPVIEAMILDGVVEHRHVLAYVRSLTAGVS